MSAADGAAPPDPLAGEIVRAEEITELAATLPALAGLDSVGLLALAIKSDGSIGFARTIAIDPAALRHLSETLPRALQDMARAAEAGLPPARQWVRPSPHRLICVTPVRRPVGV